ncbi:MAG: hypothetical protein GX308_05795 [Epulopiscium sp.]|nr:hypothetical protein [Candidatus Epulonipiscium sp.]
MSEFIGKLNRVMTVFLNKITFGVFFRNKIKKFDELYQKDEFYDDAQKANALCEELMDIGKQKINLLKMLQELSKKAKELEKFKLLTAEDLKRIRHLLFDYKAVIEEKESLKGRLISKNRILSKIQQYESEFPEIMNEIEEAEGKQTGVKRDVDYLEGEKEALIYSREQIENAQIIMHKVSIGMIIILGAVALVFSYIIMNKETRILVPATITGILAVGIGTWIYIFRRRLDYELKKNGRMQARAIKLLNKAKIRYVYYTNFLEYEYGKFNVDSAEQLERNWELYKKNKHNEKRFKSINSTMTRIEDEVLGILKKRKIYVEYFEDVKKWSKIEERRKALEDIQNERVSLESQLALLDTYQEDIWLQLNELKDNDDTEDKVVGKIIENYLEEIQ